MKKYDPHADAEETHLLLLELKDSLKRDSLIFIVALVIFLAITIHFRKEIKKVNEPDPATFKFPSQISDQLPDGYSQLQLLYVNRDTHVFAFKYKGDIIEMTGQPVYYNDTFLELPREDCERIFPANINQLCLYSQVDDWVFIALHYRYNERNVLKTRQILFDAIQEEKAKKINKN